MNTIQNPILPGFNPDPSMIRVGDDYYIATSTFEWYPGIQIHHSKDLINWKLITRPLSRAPQLNMLGNPDSCGVWAPCLSHHNGLFYLIYTDVKRFDGNFKDTHNYLVSCDRIDGEWSDPIYLNSSGFDPSLFHDDDGKKWLVNPVWDHRPDRNRFGGILLQEYSTEQKKLVGPIKNIYSGTPLGYTEGPHLYKRNGYYYLLTAEGGTGPNHAVTMSRSQCLEGPYENHPNLHVVTAKDDPVTPIRRSGHGSFVDTQEGETYLVHLCSRPLPNRGTSPMGRETAIQKVEWKADNWMYLSAGGLSPQATVPAPGFDSFPLVEAPVRDHFDSTELGIDYQWLRTPWPEEFMSLTENPGHLRLKGMESLGSWFRSALIARRQQAFCFTAETKVDFEPENFQQMAGLTCYYNTHKYHYCYVSWDEEVGKHIAIMSCFADQSFASSFPGYKRRIPIPSGESVYLRAEVDYERLYFSWSLDGEGWNLIPVLLDQSMISDEAGKGEGGNFTGAFVGICCQDISGTQKNADFDYFDYRERDFQP